MRKTKIIAVAALLASIATAATAQVYYRYDYPAYGYSYGYPAYGYGPGYGYRWMHDDTRTGPPQWKGAGENGGG